MSGRTAVLAVRIIADNKEAIRGVDQMGRSVDKAGGRLSKLRAPAAAALGGIALLAKGSLDAASDLQQSTGAVQSVYGKFAGSIIKNAKKAAGAVGLSQAAYQQQAVLLGSQLKNLGTPIDQVAGKTQGLIQRASDLAATFGGSTADAVEAIGSLMRGETDPIERYGVSINQASIKAYALAHNLPMATDAQQKQAKSAAVLALLYKQTAAASGQFARETNTAAGASEIASAKFENAKAALGKRLLPVYAKFKTILATVAGWVSRNSRLVFILGGIIGTAAIAILSINAATKAWAAASKAMATVQAVLNTVMSANPAVRIALAITALGVALVVAYKKSETFRNIVNAVFGAVKAAVEPVVDFFVHDIPHAFGVVFTALKTVWSNVTGFLRKWGPTALLILAPFIGIPLLIARHFGKIIGWIRDTWNTVTRDARQFVSTVAGAILSIPSRIGALAGKMFHAGASFIQSFFKGIGNIVAKVGDFASTIAHSVVNAIIKGLNALLDLPWEIKLHIPIPWAPDIDFGPYTLLPRIPLWNSAAGLVDGVVGPASAATPALDVRDLRPGFSLMGAGGVSMNWPAQLARETTASTIVDRRSYSITFPGLVTDPEGVARKIRDLSRRSDERRGLTRTAVVIP